MSVDFDTRQLLDLSADLARLPARTITDVAAVTAAAALRLATTWRANATITAGAHGRHYPKAITFDMAPALSMNVGAIIGPDSSMPQGGMGRGFEYGSRNQEPHLDGNHAADTEEPKYVADVTAAVLRAMGREVPAMEIPSGLVDYTTLSGRVIQATPAQASAYAASRR